MAQAYTENVPLLVIPSGYSLKRQYNQPTFRAADVVDAYKDRVDDSGQYKVVVVTEALGTWA